MLFKLLVTFLFSVSCISAAQAETLLTWEECVRIASLNNAQLLAAQAQLRSLDYLEGASKSNFLPQLSASGSYGKTKVENEGDVNTAATSTSSTAYSGSLSASLNIFSGFLDVGRMWQAQANEKAGEANLRTVKAQVSLDLKTAFMNLLYAKEYQKLTKKIIGRREENSGLVDLRFQGGRENKGSVLLSKAYLAQAKYDDLQARNAQRVARRQLARALGYDEFAQFDITGEIPAVSPNTNVIPPFEQLALETPDIANVKAVEEASEAAVIVARAQFFPSVNLTGSIVESDSHYFPDQEKTTRLGVSVSFPFFTGGKDYYATRSSIEGKYVAQSNRRNISRLVLTRLEQTYAAFVEALTKFEVDKSFQDATQVRAEIARNKYNNGLLTFEDWDVIESDLINRQKTYLSSKRDRVIAESTWEQAQGKGALK